MASIARLNIALADADPGSITWLSDGVENGDGSNFATALAGLAGTADFTVVVPDAASLPLVLDPPVNAAASLDVQVRAAQASGGRTGTLRALDLKGAVIAETPFAFAPGTDVAEAAIEMPVELRNDIAAWRSPRTAPPLPFTCSTTSGAGAPSASSPGATADRAQPLLSPLYYITRAIKPFADLREPRTETLRETVAQLTEQRVSVIVLADIGALTGAQQELTEWVEAGGVLLRFAGPRMAASANELIPVRLRRGERSLGGTLSWTEPQALADFPAASPFAGWTCPRTCSSPARFWPNLP